LDIAMVSDSRRDGKFLEVKAFIGYRAA